MKRRVCVGLPVAALIALLGVNGALGVDVPADQIRPLPASPGDGLSGAFWKRPGRSLSAVLPRTAAGSAAFIADSEQPDARFRAVVVHYQGSDAATAQSFLAGDGASLTPADPGSINDGLIRLSGFYRADEAGPQTFLLRSDDGAVLWIGGALIVNNDGLHSPANVFGVADFPAPGLYPIEVIYFNRAVDANIGGGALSLLNAKAAPVDPRKLYPDDGETLPPTDTPDDSSNPIPGIQPLFAGRDLPAPGKREFLALPGETRPVYELYLPTSYSAEGPALPILYTFNPDGGGMVHDFIESAEAIQMIVVGFLASRNGRRIENSLADLDLTMRDLQDRLRIDPSAVLASGFSGGGYVSYYVARYFQQRFGGAFGMAGHLNNDRRSFLRYLPGLAVARATGDEDSIFVGVLPGDRAHFERFGVTVKDYPFSGGHTIPSPAMRTEALNWILAQRVQPGAQEEAEGAAVQPGLAARTPGVGRAVFPA